MSIEMIVDKEDWLTLLHQRMRTARKLVQGYEGLITRYEAQIKKGPVETYIEDGHLHFRPVKEIRPPYKQEQEEYPHV